MKYFEQSRFYTCGPACARMMLDDIGIELSEVELIEILETNCKVGTTIDKWGNLNHLCQVQSGFDSTLEHLDSLMKDGWKITVMVDDGLPHYLTYRGCTQHKVLYFNPYHFADGSMKINQFLKRWIVETDLYGSVTTISNWYVAIK